MEGRRMNNLILEKRYERNMQHNYLVIQGDEEYAVEEYVYRMLLDNNIQGLLPVSSRVEDGKELYYYEINSMQPIERLFERKCMSYADIEIMIRSYIEVVLSLEEHLLDQQGLILDSDSIYYHAGENRMKFVFYPYYEKNSQDALRSLTEYILMKTDHTSEDAVRVAYRLYKIAREENTTIEDMKAVFDKAKEKPVVTERSSMERKSDMPEIRREEIPFAPDPVEDEKFYQEDKKNANRNKTASIVCIFLAIVCLAALVSEKVFGLYRLPEQYEMILFASIVMFAVGGIIFRVISDKKQKFDSEEFVLKERQKDKINDEFGNAYIREVEKEKQIEIVDKRKEEDSFKQVDWNHVGETTVIGMNDTKKGLCLRRIDGLGNEQYDLNHFPFLIGRMAQCVDMVLNDSSVSKMHARIEEREGSLYLQDMNSTNGTMKNGILLKLNESTPIYVGDEITFGKMTFKYL